MVDYEKLQEYFGQVCVNSLAIFVNDITDLLLKLGFVSFVSFHVGECLLINFNRSGAAETSVIYNY